MDSIKKIAEEALAAAAVFDPMTGKLKGHEVVLDDGRVVLARPGRLSVGPCIAGLKPNESLKAPGKKPAPKVEKAPSAVMPEKAEK